MAEDYYGGAGDTEEKEPTPESEGEDMAQEALLPRSFFPENKDVKPGSVCKVRVESVMDDEVAVSYVNEGKKENDKED